MTTESRTDVELVHAATRALVESPAVDHSAIRVTADAGRVELTGRVSTHAQRLAAATIVSKLSGVTALDNQLTIGELDLDAARATDEELTAAATRAVAASTVTVDDMRLEVRQHVATLHGRVGSERDRATLRHALERVPGVHFVDNRVEVEPTGPGVEELDPAACFELLGAEGIGRLAIQEGSGVDIFPVNYRVHDDKVYFRSGPGVKLIRIVEAPDVAFEADGHEEAWTWSVVVKGHAERLDDDAEILSSGILRAATAHPGDKFSYVRIQPRQITGRRFRRVR